MKAFKLNKKMMSDPVALLRAVGAVNKELGTAFPSQVFMNKKDYSKLKNNVEKMFKKEIQELGGTRSKQYEFSVGLYMLNYAPVKLEKGIQPGYVLVDNHAIQKEIEVKSGK